MFSNVFTPMKMSTNSVLGNISGSLRLVVKQEVAYKHAQCMYVPKMGGGGSAGFHVRTLLQGCDSAN